MRHLVLSAAAAGALSLAASAASAAPGPMVDLELGLVIDVSGSVDSGEYTLQLDGYAAAFRDAGISRRIAASPNGVAVSVYQFASGAITAVAPTLLDSAGDVSTFADLLDNLVRPSSGSPAELGGTTIGATTHIYDGVDLAVQTLTADEPGGFVGARRVIDVSGDGTASLPLTRAARDRAAAEGITVNGLAIQASSSTSTALLQFYEDTVITPDGFALASNGFEAFAEAVTRKIGREIDVLPELPPDPTPVDPDPVTPPVTPPVVPPGPDAPAVVPLPAAALPALATLAGLGGLRLARRRRPASL